MPLPRELSVAELKVWLANAERPPPVLLDVRTPGEVQLAALTGAVLVPLQELVENLDTLEEMRGRPIVCFCHHGIRSLSAAVVLEEAGFEATSLRGGIDAWSQLVDPAVPRY
jgi:rhodanese-related sulfurtransferase